MTLLAVQRRCRLVPRRGLLFLLALLLLVFLAASHLGLLGPQQAALEGHPCSVSSEQRYQLFTLLASIHLLFSNLGIAYFLCYDSLWGAIQESGPLPWDANAYLCALSAHISKHDEASLLRAFRREKLLLEYSAAEGHYTISNSTAAALSASSGVKSPTVQVVLFEEDTYIHMMRRVGWRRRLLPPDCEAHPSLSCFPPALVRLPLPLHPFGPLVLPVPHENMDLLKFHYPETWWKPLQPKC
ncbi:uncharacterized protein LOC143038582 [Oratosquilla oratoria]|uniref:uncharacterized protein LOC143038582 n=1 Tax=Oratosquilla oratoria TaxID=337810 RepID=UPI003F76E4AB